MAMTTGTKVAIAAGAGLGVAALLAAASSASAQTTAAACDDTPQTAATYTTQAQLRAWVLCVGRSAAEANALSVALTGAGRADDAAYVRSCWAQRAQLQAAPPDGSLTPSGKAQTDSAFRAPPATPPADPLPDPGAVGGGKGGARGGSSRRLPGGGKGDATAAPRGDRTADAPASRRRLPGRSDDDTAPPARSRGGSRLADHVAPPSDTSSADAPRRRLPGRSSHGSRDTSRAPHAHMVAPGDPDAEERGVRVERVPSDGWHSADETPPPGSAIERRSDGSWRATGGAVTRGPELPHDTGGGAVSGPLREAAQGLLVSLTDPDVPQEQWSQDLQAFTHEWNSSGRHPSLSGHYDARTRAALTTILGSGVPEHPRAHVVMGARPEELGHDKDDTIMRIGATTIRVTDPTAARRQAGPLAKMMRKAMKGDHATNIRAFQKAAGLDLTGRYDGAVVNALRYYGINDPPAELYDPKASDPSAVYKPQG